MKIRAGDSVVIISGKDKGKTGTVLRILQTSNRMIVGGVNMRTRHIKKTPQNAGQKFQYEASIHASNVMLIDPKSKKRTRAGFKIDPKGKKTRISKRSGEEMKHVKPAAKIEKTTSKTAKAKEAKEKKSETKLDDTAAPSKKQPFWNRMGLGQDPMDIKEGDVPRSKEDKSIPQETTHVRPGNRGA